MNMQMHKIVDRGRNSSVFLQKKRRSRKKNDVCAFSIEKNEKILYDFHILLQWGK